MNDRKREVSNRQRPAVWLGHKPLSHQSAVDDLFQPAAVVAAADAAIEEWMLLGRKNDAGGPKRI